MRIASSVGRLVAEVKLSVWMLKRVEGGDGHLVVVVNVECIRTRCS